MCNRCLNVVRLNEALIYFTNWLAEHHLPLKLKKTKALLITPATNKKKGGHNTPITMARQLVEVVDCIRHLAIYVDNHIQWTRQFKAVRQFGSPTQSGLPNSTEPRVG